MKKEYLELKVDEIYLLVWLTIHNMKDLGEVLSKYTETPKEYYSNEELTKILEDAIIQFSECYNIKGLFRQYFYYKRMFPNEDYAVLRGLFHIIRPTIFNDEDIENLQKLKKEYIDSKGD